MKVTLQVANNKETHTYNLHLTKRQVTNRARLIEAILNEFGTFNSLKVMQNDKIVFSLG